MSFQSYYVSQRQPIELPYFQPITILSMIVHLLLQYAMDYYHLYQAR